jgi:thioredoxin-related protein
MVLAMIVAGGARANDVALAGDLRDDGANGDKPVIVFFSATYCAYCTAVKSEFFRHLETDPRYASRIVVREVVIDSRHVLEDFQGRQVTHGAFASANGVSLVPTVRFFDGGGRQLAKQMVGVTSMDYYGWYLDQRIRNSLERLADAPGADAATGESG